MRSLLFILFISLLAVLQITAQPSHSEKDYQATKERAIKLKDTNLDSSITIFRSALKTFNTPQQKIDLLNELGRAYELARQLDTALIILEEAKLLAQQHNREDLLASILFNIGFTYNTAGEKRQALNLLQESYLLATRFQDMDTQYSALNMIGRVYSYISEADSASIYLNKALDIIIKLRDKERQSKTLMELGTNAARANQIPQAMEHYHQSIAVAKEINDYYMIIWVYCNIAYTYAYYGNFPLALENYQNAMEIAEEIGSVEEQANTSIHFATIYTSLNDLDQAISYYEKAGQLWEKEGNANQLKSISEKKGDIYLLKKDYRQALDQFLQSWQMVELENKNHLPPPLALKVGTCYEKLNLLDSARIYYKLSLDIASKNTSESKEIAESLIGLVRINLTQGHLDLALSYALQALNISQERENDELIMNTSALLYQIYKAKGAHDLALRYHELFRELQDSLFSRQNVKQIAQLEAQSQFDRQKQQLEFERQQERQQARSRQLFILIITGSLAIFLFLAYRSVLAKKRTNTQLSQLNEQLAEQNTIVEGQKRQLEELDQMKSRFFTNISHEFRTPLTIIGGMVEQMEKAPAKWLINGLKLIKRNNFNLLNLVNQILDLRKLESGSLQLELIQGNVIFYLKYILESFHSLAEAKSITLHFSSDETEILMDYDKEKLLRIVSNLLSNAIKFTPTGGSITLGVLETPRVMTIQVTDTGMGIPEAKLPYIFDRFYQADDSSTREGEGTGIGLALTKELVKLMNGRIEVESEVGKGSTFSVVLPITKNAPREKSKVPDPGQEATEEVASETAKSFLPLKEEVGLVPSANERSTLLIIEDNPDLVEYLESLLSDQYDLEIARDGQEGIEIALEQIPDLILSDVMMPRKDGFEVCETLKNDQRTSHIPIVLLTARADADSRITGLKRGADAYLAKPFNQEELFIRLEKLHQLRLQLQARYSSLEPQLQGNSPESSESTQVLTLAEDAFMQELRTTVESNLDNEHFAVPELCRAIGMSRPQLHRKIKALTNRSTTHYIRSIRLHKAKELLQLGDLNVTQVAFEVGFQNRAYFSRAFSEEFGISPKDFSNN